MQITTTHTSYTFSVLEEDKKLMLREYPFLEHGTIGTSVLGKPLSFFRFGIGAKKILLCGAHHGKEWITAMLLMRILEECCALYTAQKRFGEQDLTVFYHTHSLYIIPLLNPDGVDLCIRGLTDDIPPFYRSRLIGMNGGKRDFIGAWQANIRGVDLNHNYNALFEKGRSLAFADGIYGPGPSRFSGESPESEPESHALAEFTRHILPDIVIAYHAQGKEIFHSFNGFTPKGSNLFLQILAEKTGYKPITASGLTDCSGYKDWVIDTLHIPAYTIEVGLGVNPLPLSCFSEIFAENFPAIIHL